MEYTVSATAFAQKKKTWSPERVVYRGALAVSGLSVLYLLSVFVTGQSWLPYTSFEGAHSELTLALIQCILGTAALHVPLLIKKRLQIKMPDALCACFYVFVLCATVLGEMFSLYYRIPVWDSLLHGSSGVMIGILAVKFLCEKGCRRILSPGLIALAIICMTLCVGVFWEIYEFAGDSLLGLNMQKCLLEDGTALVGQAALLDTMKDLMMDLTGGIIAAVSACFSLKQKKGWLYAFLEGKMNSEKRDRENACVDLQ